MESFPDELVGPGVTGLPERFFDRFVFNLHRTDATAPSIIFGLGIHPVRDTVDGFAILTTRTEQRNVRFATELSATGWSSCGPLSWQVIEPMTTWHVALGPNPTHLQFDLTWRARTPAWYGDVTVTNRDGGTTSFEHLFQSGWYDGTLAIDGVGERIAGWYGQRDRSRGVRTMSGGQGLHIWYQAQFPDRSVGFLLVVLVVVLLARERALVLAAGCVAAVVLPSVLLQISSSGSNIILSWPSGTLQQSGQAAGPYSDMTGVTSPYTNAPSGAQKFFRVRVQ